MLKLLKAMTYLVEKFILLVILQQKTMGEDIHNNKYAGEFSNAGQDAFNPNFDQIKPLKTKYGYTIKIEKFPQN